MIQGLGFVGAAMAVATALARDIDGQPIYNVVGLELDNEEGRRRATALADGCFPFVTTDSKLVDSTSKCQTAGNLTAKTSRDVISSADIVVVDINLDVSKASDGLVHVEFEHFRSAIRDIGKRARPGTLIIVETTVPPGTCAKIAAPELTRCCAERGLPDDSILLAHSYERVMPGSNYLESIREFWRVYSGHTDLAATACRSFLENIIDVKRYPLTRLANTTSTEFAKVLENAYRATNIAFIEEWARLAERTGVDMFEVIDAIRMRPTHSNLRQPGFGVGGYCLTKDPLLGGVSARQIFGLPDLKFPFSEAAVQINDRMPLETVTQLKKGLGGNLNSKRILLFGAAYRQDVGDTRFSPSAIFVRATSADGAIISVYDPLVDGWGEPAQTLHSKLPKANEFDAVVFAVPHAEFSKIDIVEWLGISKPYLLDANRVLTVAQRKSLHESGVIVRYVGVGELKSEE